MPSREILERFISRVEENAHVEAVEEFYTEHSTMRENNMPPRIGRTRHIENERKMMSRVKSMSSVCVRPIFVNGDLVVIRWIFDFEWRDGSKTHLEELSYQCWENDRISDEQFFYDPQQHQPR